MDCIMPSTQDRGRTHAPAVCSRPPQAAGARAGQLAHVALQIDRLYERLSGPQIAKVAWQASQGRVCGLRARLSRVSLARDVSLLLALGALDRPRYGRVVRRIDR